MPTVIITRDQLLDLVFKTGAAGADDVPPTLHDGEDAFGGRPDQERRLEDALINALGLRRAREPAGGWVPREHALARFDAGVARLATSAEQISRAGNGFLAAMRLWGVASIDARADATMAEEGWSVSDTPDRGWTVVRRNDAYMWETDFAALEYVRERAPASALHQAAIGLVDAQILVAGVLGIGGVP